MFIKFWSFLYFYPAVKNLQETRLHQQALQMGLKQDQDQGMGQLELTLHGCRTFSLGTHPVPFPVGLGNLPLFFLHCPVYSSFWFIYSLNFGQMHMQLKWSLRIRFALEGKAEQIQIVKRIFQATCIESLNLFSSRKITCVCVVC